MGFGRVRYVAPLILANALGCLLEKVRNTPLLQKCETQCTHKKKEKTAFHRLVNARYYFISIVVTHVLSLPISEKRSGNCLSKNKRVDRQR